MYSHWEIVKQNFKTRLAPSAYQLWIEPLHVSQTDSGSLTLECPNSFFLHWVHNNYFTDIIREYQNVAGQLIDLKLSLIKPVPRRDVALPKLQPLLPSIKKNDGVTRLLNQSFTFERFVVGASNRLAFQASRALANDDTLYSKTLFLASQPGLGKSHLSQAVGNYIQKNFQSNRVLYLTAEDFANEMVAALRQGHMSQFKEKFRRQCDALLLEGVHFLSGKEKIQSELCYTLDFLADQNKKLIFTSPYLPGEIPLLRQELVSRLSGGVITPIDPPDFATRVKILSGKALEHQVKVPHEVLEHLATYLTQDVRQMTSALDNVLLKAATLKIPVSIDLADEVLQDFQVVSQKLKIEDIQRLSSKVYQVTIEDIVGKSRKKNIVKARNLAIYLCRHYLQKNLKELARTFRRTHSTILHSLECVERELKVSTKFAAELEHLEKRLQTSPRWRHCLHGDSNPPSSV